MAQTAWPPPAWRSATASRGAGCRRAKKLARSTRLIGQTLRRCPTDPEPAFIAGRSPADLPAAELPSDAIGSGASGRLGHQRFGSRCCPSASPSLVQFGALVPADRNGADLQRTRPCWLRGAEPFRARAHGDAMPGTSPGGPADDACGSPGLLRPSFPPIGDGEYYWVDTSVWRGQSRGASARARRPDRHRTA